MKTVVALASAYMIAFSAAVRADDLQVLEERFAEVECSAVPAAAAGRIRDAQHPDGSWDGVDYACSSLREHIAPRTTARWRMRRNEDSTGG